MRSLYGVETLLIAAAAMSVAGGFMQAADARSNAEAEASYLEAERDQERKQAARDADALAKEEHRLQSRARALLAAGGGGTTGGSALALLTSNSREYAIKGSQMEDDSEARVSSLEARAKNTRDAGDRAANMAIFGGVAKGVGLYAQSQTLSAAPRAKTSVPGPTYGPYGKNGRRPY